jgi:hypothetical protein
MTTAVRQASQEPSDATKAISTLPHGPELFY